MTRTIKMVLMILWALLTAVEVAWLKTETMMYLAGAPVWFAFFEAFDRTGSWLSWLWLAIALLQIVGLLAAPVCAVWRRYKPFLVVLGGQLVIRLIWLFRAAADFRLAFALAFVLHAALFAGAVWLFTRRDMDA